MARLGLLFPDPGETRASCSSACSSESRATLDAGVRLESREGEEPCSDEVACSSWKDTSSWSSLERRGGPDVLESAGGAASEE